jgi:predicted kinase
VVRFGISQRGSQQLQGVAREGLCFLLVQPEIGTDGARPFAVTVGGHDGGTLGGRQLREGTLEPVEQLRIRRPGVHCSHVFQQHRSEWPQARRAVASGLSPAAGSGCHSFMVPAAAHSGETAAATPAAPASIWVVAGAPGSGKSTVADLLIEAFREAGRPVPALLDKDTLYGGFVAATLAAAGRPADEREGDWYDAHVKRHEYAGMTATAREISARGCPVLLSAPFTQQIRNSHLWERWVGELGGGRVELVYVRSDAETLASRLAARASSRDGGKRADFAAFLGRMQPDVSPPVPHQEIDNRGGAPDLGDQIRRLLGTSGGLASS